jgi:hypothetical protein
MRKTTFNGSFASPRIICEDIDNPETFLGIRFGFDLVPEHQKGLRPMWDELGVPHKLVPENFGLKMYHTTKFPKDRFFFEKGEMHTCLTFESGTEPLQGWKNQELDNKPEDIATAWDDKSFGIVVPNEYSSELNQLYEAFQRKDVLVQYPLDQTYIYLQHHYLLITILSRTRPRQEEKAFAAHVEAYANENKQTIEI